MTNQTQIYAFTGEQLTKLLEGTIDMFIEYRDQHGRDESAAKDCSVCEMVQGLDADIDLRKECGVRTSTLQLTRSDLAREFSNPSLDWALNSGDGSYRP
jgi:hypothetical protein